MANIISRTKAGRFGTLAGGLILAAGVWVGLGGSIGAAPPPPEPTTCLPNPDCAIDGRHLVVAGDDNTTLGAQTITIGLVFDTAVSLETEGNFELFDGDNDANNWDVPFDFDGDGNPLNDPNAPQLIVELLADPNSNGGIGNTPIQTWNGTFPVTNNGWNGVTFPHIPEAVALDGKHVYAVRITPLNPAVDQGWNAFKVRAAGTVTLISDQVVGFIASMSPFLTTTDFDTIYPPPGFPNTVYNGTWSFKTRLPAGLDEVTVFDGDMDFGNARFVDAATTICDYKDTDDPDTTGVPPFANAAASPEGVAVGGDPCTNGGVATGQPADDTGAIGYRRTRTFTGAGLEGIAYQIVAPDGQVFLNQNPSGNREWEQFRIQKVAPAHVTRGACPEGGYAAGEDGYPQASDCRTSEMPGGVWDVQLDGMDMQNLNFWFFSFKVEPIDEGETYFLVIDEDSIDNGIGPNFFSAFDVNDQIAKLGQRNVLPRFDGQWIGTELILYTGQTHDEGWFSVPTIPASWANAGPTEDGRRNFVGLPVGPGLGTGNDPEKLLDKIPDVTPWNAPMLYASVGNTYCAVVYDSDISINYTPLNGSLKGANLGIVAFKVLEVTPRTGSGTSSSSLPQVRLEILNAHEVCAQELVTAPLPANLKSDRMPMMGRPGGDRMPMIGSKGGDLLPMIRR